MEKSEEKRPTLVVRLTAQWHRRLKVEAAKRAVSMKSLVAAALESYLARRAS